MIIELCNKKEIWIISLSLKCVDVDIFLIVCDKNAEEDKKCRCARIRWSCTVSGVVKVGFCLKVLQSSKFLGWATVDIVLLGGIPLTLTVEEILSLCLLC